MVCPNYIQYLHVSSSTESLGCEKILADIIIMLVTTVERNSFSHWRSWKWNQAGMEQQTDRQNYCM